MFKNYSNIGNLKINFKINNKSYGGVNFKINVPKYINKKIEYDILIKKNKFNIYNEFPIIKDYYYYKINKLSSSTSDNSYQNMRFNYIINISNLGQIKMIELEHKIYLNYFKFNNINTIF